VGVQIQGKVRKDDAEFNGLETAVDTSNMRPGQRFLTVAEFELVAATTDYSKGGEVTPKLRLISAEVVDGDARDQARKLRDEAYHARTGQTAPPPTLFDEDEGKDDDRPWPGDAEPAASADEDAPAAGETTAGPEFSG